MSRTTITVYASGDYDHNFEVTDDIPQGTTFVSADGGDTWDCGFSDPTVTCTADDVSGSDINGSVITVTVHVPSSFTDEGIENCASIQKVYEPKGVESDGYNWVWTSCADTEITREFDISIEKTGPASLVVPANAVYTITASNAGPSDSDLVSFTDPVPAGTTLVGVDGGTAWDCSATTRHRGRLHDPRRHPGRRIRVGHGHPLGADRARGHGARELRHARQRRAERRRPRASPAPRSRVRTSR